MVLPLIFKQDFISWLQFLPFWLAFEQGSLHQLKLPEKHLKNFLVNFLVLEIHQLFFRFSAKFYLLHQATFMFQLKFQQMMHSWWLIHDVYDVELIGSFLIPELQLNQRDQLDLLQFIDSIIYSVHQNYLFSDFSTDLTSHQYLQF